jgi:hypothetical protein
MAMVVMDERLQIRVNPEEKRLLERAAFSVALEEPARVNERLAVALGRRGSGSLIELRRPAALDPAVHDRSRFDCGAAGLHAWLRRYVGQNRRRDTRRFSAFASASPQLACG